MLESNRTRFAPIVAALAIALPQAAAGDIFKKPSTIVGLETGFIDPGNTADLLEITPAAINAGVFTIPPKRVFVITTVSVFPVSLGAGEVIMELKQGIATRTAWTFPSAQPTQLQFPTGLVVGPGVSMSVANSPASAGTVQVSISGYLAKDK